MDRQAIKDTFKPLVKSPYIFISAFFLFWLMFVDEDTLFLRFELSRKLSHLEDEKEQLQHEIDQTRRKMDELMSSKDNLEKFTREEYFMKKDDEVIFIIKD